MNEEFKPLPEYSKEEIKKMLLDASKITLENLQNGKIPINAAAICKKCAKPISTKFCTECGALREQLLEIKCIQCGWTSTINDKVGKFCPECGDPITIEDVIMP